MRDTNGIVKPLILMVILLIIAIGASFYWLGSDSDINRVDDQLVFEAFRGEFVSTIMESGSVESSSNHVIKCSVKSRGSAGTTILRIIPEGEFVEKGDFLVQFDDSDHRDRLFEQQIELEKNKAAKIQAESDLEAAKKLKIEYLGTREEDEGESEENSQTQDGNKDPIKGTRIQEIAAIELEIAIAADNLKRAERYYQFSKKLNAKNFISSNELQADKFAYEKAKMEMQIAQDKLALLTTLSQQSTLQQLEAEIRKHEANLKAAEFTVKLSELRVDELQQQVDNCRIIAPRAGQVVYANENDRDNSIIIEEGAIIRDGQEVIFLPDPDKMQVRTKVNDSKINLVRQGNPVEIRLDSAPEEVIKGQVREVAKFPLPQRWYQAPIEYEVFVDVVEDNPLVKSGLRAKSKITVDRQQDVLQIPASSIIRREDLYFVAKVEGNRYAAQQVDIGATNDKFVIILDGLNPGEKVLINPEKQKDKLNYPES